MLSFDTASVRLGLLRPGLSECAVLLRRNGAFPLAGPCPVALYGSGARGTVFGGTGSGEVNAPRFVSIEEGLEEAGFTVTTKPWLDAYDAFAAEARSAFLKRTAAAAKAEHRPAIVACMGAVMPQPEYELPLDGEGDCAVYVVSRISGEGSDRVIEGDVLLTASEIRDILALNQRFERFMLVLNVGGPVDLSPVLEVGNILLLSQLGVETGCALADMLLGVTAPSGKLATTWYRWEDAPKIGDFGERDDTHYTEGVYVGYRYFDSVGVSPLFPFGFGLGYTDFKLGTPEITLTGETLKLTVPVENVGQRDGMETVQLYVSVPSGVLDQPYQTLAAFAKTALLRPGDSEPVELSFRLSELAGYDDARAVCLLEAGDYVLRLGVSSRDTAAVGVVEIPAEILTARLKSPEGESAVDWKPEPRPAEPLPPDLPRFVLDPAAIVCREPVYDAPFEIDPMVAEMSDEMLALYSVGAFDPRGGLRSVIGDAGRKVPGSAGETCGALEARGFPVLTMADGPAGLRLMREYAVDDKGVVPLGEDMPASLAELLPGFVRGFLKLMKRKPAANAEIRTQNCTAIPIGTAIAQSWNTEFARLCGEVVGDEMLQFGVNLWLAPALNIHRSIRCGRNFEYYSEDPLISGKMAAAVTRAVQARRGCGVTIKHFCCNNQETNRYQSDSIVSRRAMREIYLRGFEICIRESHPLAVMTSYNLLNGVHTSERRDLIEDILRAEFGFGGFVMSDWLIFGMNDKRAAHPFASAEKIPAAGNDVLMPGGKRDCKRIRNALKNGTLGREQAQKNVTRLLRVARYLFEPEVIFGGDAPTR